MVRHRAPPRLPSRGRHSHDGSQQSRIKNSPPAVVSSIPNYMLKLMLYACSVLFLLILISSHRSLPSNNNSHPGRLPLRLRQAFSHNYLQYDRNHNSFTGIARSVPPRIAIVLPFIGKGPESIPPYLGLFCAAAGGSASLVDFLIIHPGVLEQYATRNNVCPPNVKFINVGSMENLANNYLLRVMDYIPEEEWALDNRDVMTRIVAKYLMAYPYALVEYKPTFGHVFAEFLEGYSHWGYSDLDILFGDLSRWITPDELHEYDIVTYGYGDQNRIYLRGQFTFHKNEHRINTLFRKCDYLSHLDQRFSKVLSGEQKLRFESAEGCYSAAILDRQDLRVKYAVKAFTDTQDTDTVYSHGLYVGLQKDIISMSSKRFFGRKIEEEHHTKTVVIYKAHTKDGGKDLLRSSPGWFEKDNVYADTDQPLQWEVGRKQVLELNDPKKSANCMYWAQKKYQSRLCVSGNVTEYDTVFWVNGQLFKQRYQNAKLDTNVATAPFFHFQEWKRYYREGQLAAFRPDSEFTTFILTKEGAIPLLPRQVEGSGHFLRQSASAFISPLGKSILHWKAGNAALDRALLPRRNYCLKSAPRRFPPVPPAPECLQQVSWWDEDRVHILSMAPAWQTDLDTKLDVTLVMTVQVPIYQSSDPSALNNLLDIVISNLNRWQGQASVLIFHIAVDDNLQRDDVLALLELRFRQNVINGSLHGERVPVGDETISNLSYGVESCLIAAIFADLSEGLQKNPKQKDKILSYHVSRKALLNMAIDAVPTRWFVSGIEIERGMLLSRDAAFFTHRTVLSHQNMPGNIFWIPQFALDVQDDFEQVFTLSNLLQLKTKEGTVKKPVEFEKDLCAEPAGQMEPRDIFGKATGLWWDMAESIVNDSSSYVQNDAVTAKRAEIQDELQIALSGLLGDENHFDLFAMDESPILLTDNQGPHDGMYTFEIVREVEEFGGKMCYNGLRPAQLVTWGYNINVLPGAFAASTVSSRSAADRSGSNAGSLGEDDESSLGSSRCDGCFMFDEAHESILEGIAKDERKRPAKAAVLWDEPGPGPKSAQ